MIFGRLVFGICFDGVSVCGCVLGGSVCECDVIFGLVFWLLSICCGWIVVVRMVVNGGDMVSNICDLLCIMEDVFCVLVNGWFYFLWVVGVLCMCDVDVFWL